MVDAKLAKRKVQILERLAERGIRLENAYPWPSTCALTSGSPTAAG